MHVLRNFRVFLGPGPGAVAYAVYATAGKACGLNGSSWFSRQNGVRIGCRSSEMGQFVAAAPCSGYKSATVIVDGHGYRERKRAEN